MATQMPPTSPQPGTPPVAARTPAVEPPGDPSNVRILAAEIVGTAVLMIGGPGSAVLAAGGHCQQERRCADQPRRSGADLFGRTAVGG